MTIPVLEDFSGVFIYRAASAVEEFVNGLQCFTCNVSFLIKHALECLNVLSMHEILSSILQIFVNPVNADVSGMGSLLRFIESANTLAKGSQAYRQVDVRLAHRRDDRRNVRLSHRCDDGQNGRLDRKRDDRRNGRLARRRDNRRHSGLDRRRDDRQNG